jgi:hypothetical protein
MMTADDGRIIHRRTIEALRSGVPNRDAVHQLGSSQGAIERQFDELLALVSDGKGNRGLVVGGDFGTGKSHLLEYLQHVAVSRGFVTSKIVVSKETPLHDPVKVYRTAIATAMVPGRRGAALREIASALDFESPGYAEFNRWVNSDEADLNERFAATLYLHRDLRNADQEFADRIVRFWSGDPIGVGELKRKLREAGEAASWALSKISIRDLALERFRFSAGLMAAAGYKGWILLFDEVELIGRYSLLQRGKSYGEIARWAQGFDDERIPWLGAVLAITDDFVSAVIDGKNDDEIVPARLRIRGDELLAARAERGMTIVQRETAPLDRPDMTVLQTTHRRLREIHSAAYGWDAPELAVQEAGITRSMRQYVRAWINEWDLRRLDPAYNPAIQLQEVSMDYTEDSDLERAPEGEIAEVED